MKHRGKFIRISDIPTEDIDKSESEADRRVKARAQEAEPLLTRVSAIFGIGLLKASLYEVAGWRREASNFEPALLMIREKTYKDAPPSQYGGPREHLECWTFPGGRPRPKSTYKISMVDRIVEKIGYLPECWCEKLVSSYVHGRRYNTKHGGQEHGWAWVPLSDNDFTHFESPTQLIRWMFAVGREGETAERIQGMAMVPLGIVLDRGRYNGVEIHADAQAAAKTVASLLGFTDIAGRYNTNFLSIWSEQHLPSLETVVAAYGVDHQRSPKANVATQEFPEWIIDSSLTSLPDILIEDNAYQLLTEKYSAEGMPIEVFVPLHDTAAALGLTWAHTQKMRECEVQPIIYQSRHSNSYAAGTSPRERVSNHPATSFLKEVCPRAGAQLLDRPRLCLKGCQNCLSGHAPGRVCGRLCCRKDAHSKEECICAPCSRGEPPTTSGGSIKYFYKELADRESTLHKNFVNLHQQTRPRFNAFGRPGAEPSSSAGLRQGDNPQGDTPSRGPETGSVWGPQEGGGDASVIAGPAAEIDPRASAAEMARTMAERARLHRAAAEAIASGGAVGNVDLAQLELFAKQTAEQAAKANAAAQAAREAPGVDDADSNQHARQHLIELQAQHQGQPYGAFINESGQQRWKCCYCMATFEDQGRLGAHLFSKFGGRSKSGSAKDIRHASEGACFFPDEYLQDLIQKWPRYANMSYSNLVQYGYSTLPSSAAPAGAAAGSAAGTPAQLGTSAKAAVCKPVPPKCGEKCGEKCFDVASQWGHQCKTTCDLPKYHPGTVHWCQTCSDLALAKSNEEVQQANDARAKLLREQSELKAVNDMLKSGAPPKAQPKGAAPQAGGKAVGKGKAPLKGPPAPDPLLPVFDGDGKTTVEWICGPFAGFAERPELHCPGICQFSFPGCEVVCSSPKPHLPVPHVCKPCRDMGFSLQPRELAKFLFHKFRELHPELTEAQWLAEVEVSRPRCAAWEAAKAAQAAAEAAAAKGAGKGLAASSAGSAVPGALPSSPVTQEIDRARLAAEEEAKLQRKAECTGKLIQILKRITHLHEHEPQKLYRFPYEQQLFGQATTGLTEAFQRPGWTEDESRELDNLVTMDAPSCLGIVALLNKHLMGGYPQASALPPVPSPRPIQPPGLSLGARPPGPPPSPAPAGPPPMQPARGPIPSLQGTPAERPVIDYRDVNRGFPSFVHQGPSPLPAGIPAKSPPAPPSWGNVGLSSARREDRSGHRRRRDDDRDTRSTSRRRRHRPDTRGERRASGRDRQSGSGTYRTPEAHINVSFQSALVILPTLYIWGYHVAHEGIGVITTSFDQVQNAVGTMGAQLEQTIQLTGQETRSTISLCFRWLMILITLAAVLKMGSQLSRYATRSPSNPPIQDPPLGPRARAHALTARSSRVQDMKERLSSIAATVQRPRAITAVPENTPTSEASCTSTSCGGLLQIVGLQQNRVERGRTRVHELEAEVARAAEARSELEKSHRELEKSQEQLLATTKAQARTMNELAAQVREAETRLEQERDARALALSDNAELIEFRDEQVEMVQDFRHDLLVLNDELLLSCQYGIALTEERDALRASVEKAARESSQRTMVTLVTAEEWRPSFIDLCDTAKASIHVLCFSIGLNVVQLSFERARRRRLTVVVLVDRGQTTGHANQLATLRTLISLGVIVRLTSGKRQHSKMVVADVMTRVPRALIGSYNLSEYSESNTEMSVRCELTQSMSSSFVDVFEEQWKKSTSLDEAKGDSGSSRSAPVDIPGMLAPGPRTPTPEGTDSETKPPETETKTEKLADGTERTDRIERAAPHATSKSRTTTNRTPAPGPSSSRRAILDTIDRAEEMDRAREQQLRGGTTAEHAPTLSEWRRSVTQRTPPVQRPTQPPPPIPFPGYPWRNVLNNQNYFNERLSPLGLHVRSGVAPLWQQPRGAPPPPPLVTLFEDDSAADNPETTQFDPTSQ